MNKLEDFKKELNDFKTIIQGKKGLITKADYGDSGPASPDMYHIEYLGDRCDRLYKMIQDLWDELEDHLETHLPPIETPEQMDRAVKALGLDKSYEVVKRQIYASNGQKTNWFLELHPKNK